MSRSLAQVETLLNEKIPRSEVKQREGGNGIKLSYLPGHYVIDRLNQIFGPTGWASEVQEMRLVHSGEQATRSGSQHVAHYVAKVRIVVEVEGRRTEHSDFGYGDGQDRSNPGKAHELAVKEASTDALKRCAKNLGMSMGLALYSKEQENVAEEDEKAPEPPKPAKEDKVRSREDLLNHINLNSRVVINKGIKTAAQIKEEMRAKYGTTSKEDLNDEQANELLNNLKELLK